jgi:hypothetical protein
MEPSVGKRFEIDWSHFGALLYQGQARWSQGQMRSIELNAQSRADSRRCSRNRADAKAQTMADPQTPASR